MTDTPSFQDLLDDFAGEVFVGRGEELSLFENALKAPRPPFLILDISGQGGVGKSTLLERYRQIVRDNRAAFGLVSEDHLEVPKILDTFAAQFQENGLDFDIFKERYRKYLELKEKVEADPKAPSGLLDFAIRGATKVGLKSLKRVPIAGDVANVFLTEDAENIIAEETSAFTKYIYQKFTNKDERILLTDTDSELTKYFLADLTASIKKEKAVLCFDTFEKTADSIEKWMISLLNGEYGKFSGNTLIVIAGRFPLGQTWMKFKKATRQVELKEFTEEEARDYLARSGITDEKLLSQFIEITDRLPVLLALLVSSPGQLPHDVSGDAVQRFLQGLTTEEYEAALIASLPSYFNSDVLKSVLGDEEGKKAFNWLSKAHFVKTSENGWVYHDVVRSMILRFFRLRSFEDFLKNQILLERYYKIQIETKFGNTNVRNITGSTKHLYLGRTYHYLNQNPSENINEVACRIFETFWDLFEVSFTQKSFLEEKYDLYMEAMGGALSNTLNDISDYESKNLINVYKDFLRVLVEGVELSSSLFEWLLHNESLSDKAKSAVFLVQGAVSFTGGEESFERTLEYFNKIVDLNQTSSFAYLLCGVINQVKNYKLAVENFSKAIELQPEHEINYFWRGKTYQQTEDYPAALADFSKAIELQPESGNNYHWRGRTYHKAKDYPAALADFSKAIELQPGSGNNYHWRGRTYYEAKDYPAALVDFSKSIELQPEEEINYFWRGITNYHAEDYPAALVDFSQAIELQPEDGNKYFWRGITYFQIGDYPIALADFSKAIELQPKDGNNYHGRGITYQQTGDYSAALADFSKAIELQPESGNNYHWRGRTYHKAKDYPAALADFSKAIELQPESGNNYHWRGRTYHKAKDYPAALVDFSKAIELQPKGGNNYHWRGKTYYEVKDYPAALVDFSKAIELQPEGGNNYHWRGKTYYKVKDYPAALVNFSKAIELLPENGFNYYKLAICYFALGKKIDFEENIRTTIKLLNDKDEKSWNEKSILALCYLSAKDLEQSQKLYTEIANQCSEKDGLQYGLENLQQFAELTGETPESKEIEKMLHDAIEK